MIHSLSVSLLSRVRYEGNDADLRRLVGTDLDRERLDGIFDAIVVRERERHISRSLRMYEKFRLCSSCGRRRNSRYI